jgi:HEAT repeats
MNRLATTNNRYKKRLAAIPALATFCDNAEQVIHVEDPESFWRIEPAFRDLLASNFIESFLLYELNAVAEDHFHFMSGSSEFHAPLVESAGYSLMLKLASPEALAAAQITSLTEHLLLAVNHYVRWAAIQGICAISREDGLECLHRSLGDHHPHIRNAAQKTLAEF